MSTIQVSTGANADEYGTHDRWFVLSLLFLNYFTLYAHRDVFRFIQPPMRQDLGLTEFQLNAFAAAFQATYAFAQIFVAYLGDRFPRRTVLLVSLTLSTASLASMGLGQGFYDMLALRILLAATQAASVPAIAGIMADCFTQRIRSRAVSFYLLSAPFSVVTAGWMGGALADSIGWRKTLFVFAGIGVVAVVILFLLLREPERTERSASGLGEAGSSLRKSLMAVLSVRSFLLVALAYVLAANASQQVGYFLPLHFFERYDMNLEQAGRTSTLTAQLGTVVGLFTGGALADRLARRWMSGRFLVQIGGLLLAVPAVFVIATAESKSVIVAALFVQGVGTWLYFANLWTTTFDVVDPATRSTAVGLLNVTSGLLGSWPYLVVGKLRDDGVIKDLTQVFLVYGFVLCAAVVVLAVLVRVSLRNDFRGGSPVLGDSKESG